MKKVLDPEMDNAVLYGRKVHDLESESIPFEEFFQPENHHVEHGESNVEEAENEDQEELAD